MPDAMEPIQAIEATLAGVRRRLRFAEALTGASLGLLPGLCAAALLLGVYKLTPIPRPSLLLVAALAVLPALVGGLRAWLRQRTLQEMAQWVDHKAGLQERLSTAWELHSKGCNPEWKRIVVQDAARQLIGVNPVRLIPLRAGCHPGWLATAATLALIAGFAPIYRTPAFLQKEQEAQAVSQTAAQLVQVTRQQLEQRQPVLEPAQKALNEVLEFGVQLSQSKLTRAEAIHDLASLSQKLEQELRKLGERPSLKPLDQAARTPSNGSAAADLQQKIDAHRQALGAADGQQQLVDKLQRALQALKESAKALASGTEAEQAAGREKLAQSLEALAQQAREAGLALSGLDEAVSALRDAQTDFFLRDINTALNQVDKLQQLAKNLQQLQQQQAKVGVSLPEQLEMGQAKAAKQRLDAVIKELKASPLTPSRIRELQEELKRSLGPAERYASLPDPLKRAANLLDQTLKAADGNQQAGQMASQGETAHQLAQAAQALDTLSQEMADADQLAATLDALDEAQQAIASGRGFRQSPGKSGRPGFGKGGKPGRGVGTWAQEEGWTQIPEDTSGWDNSGIVQDELDARGLSERDPADRRGELAPTRVKGQMSPGGSMQSITLKGVHIKGQSRVRLGEATGAAQAEAQNALNQDQVPRAYQPSVKSYFDDLK